MPEGLRLLVSMSWIRGGVRAANGQSNAILSYRVIREGTYELFAIDRVWPDSDRALLVGIYPTNRTWNFRVARPASQR